MDEEGYVVERKLVGSDDEDAEDNEETDELPGVIIQKATTGN